MLVHLARLEREGLNASVDGMRAVAARDSIGRHQLTDNPADADVVLFTQCHLLGDDWTLSMIRKSEIYRNYRSKSLVYDERDNPWCVVPGVYVSMPARWQRGDLQRAWAYYRVEFDRQTEDPDLLFSFAASPTARCREPPFALQHPRAVVERVSGFTFYDPGSRDFAQRKVRFNELMARSRFVLCPRGSGTSSIRLYEVMAAGRVPVIIAHDWVMPEGPDWAAFSIRWPEGQSDGLVEHLEAREHEWSTMADAARQAFEQYFAPDVSFHHIIEQCSRLIHRPGGSAPVAARLRRVGGGASAGALISRGKTRSMAGALRRRLLDPSHGSSV